MDELRQKLRAIQESVVHSEAVPPPPPTTAPPKVEETPKTSKGSWIVIFAVCACVILIILVCGWMWYARKQKQNPSHPHAHRNVPTSAPNLSSYHDDVEQFRQERPKSILKQGSHVSEPKHVTFAPFVQVPSQLVWHPATS